jgi:hypothetical protein
MICFCCKNSKQSKNEEKGFVKTTAFMYLEHPRDFRPLNIPQMMIHETICAFFKTIVDSTRFIRH